ncbi:MAG: DNA-3-methyladenine glycosylase [Candidatus Niyogibacteria bacterium]|nr:DNA-3-methyladenine glycosylase [Candidatus Niyogibacteria bacterium]
MRKRLGKIFFKKDAIAVSKNILGKFLVHQLSSGKRLEGKIVEVEAYVGPEDLASHAKNNKKTERNRAEFLEGGHIYIYLVYGMYWQFNISTGPARHPQCFLIRAINPIPHDKYKSANGPGKLCKYFKLDKSFYGEDITTSKRIWIEDRGETVSPKNIIAAPRIGIDYAGPYWSRRKLRFYIKNNPAVSKK